MNALPEQYLSLEEYFKLEETSDIKHEYFQGMVFAMTGAKEDHNLIAMAVGGNLYLQLDGKPCRVYPGDFRLKIEAASIYTYPDLSIICGETQFADGRQDTFVNPTMLIEVLSDSTEAYDRGKKTEFYRTIPSLQEYLLIAQDRPHIEHYRRQEHNWMFTEYSALDQRMVLDSIGCNLSLAAIYRQVRFDVKLSIPSRLCKGRQKGQPPPTGKQPVAGGCQYFPSLIFRCRLSPHTNTPLLLVISAQRGMPYSHYSRCTMQQIMSLCGCAPADFFTSGSRQRSEMAACCWWIPLKGRGVAHMSWRNRSECEELSESEDLALASLSGTLADQAFFNRAFGGHSAILPHALPFMHASTSAPFTLLEMGCGGADITRKLVEHARLRGQPIAATALDRNPTNPRLCPYAMRQLSGNYAVAGRCLAPILPACRVQPHLAAQYPPPSLPGGSHHGVAGSAIHEPRDDHRQRLDSHTAGRRRFQPAVHGVRVERPYPP